MVGGTILRAPSSRLPITLTPRATLIADHVLIDRVAEQLLQGAEDFARGDDRDLRIPQSVTEIAHAARGELRQSYAADSAIEIFKAGGTRLAFMTFGIAADVIADMAVHRLVVLPCHAFAALAAAFAMLKEPVGRILHGEFRGVAPKRSGAHLALGRDPESVGFLACSRTAGARGGRSHP